MHLSNSKFIKTRAINGNTVVKPRCDSYISFIPFLFIFKSDLVFKLIKKHCIIFYIMAIIKEGKTKLKQIDLDLSQLLRQHNDLEQGNILVIDYVLKFLELFVQHSVVPSPGKIINT